MGLKKNLHLREKSIPQTPSFDAVSNSALPQSPVLPEQADNKCIPAKIFHPFLTPPLLPSPTTHILEIFLFQIAKKMAKREMKNTKIN